jgi:hypothetical protein
MAGAGGEPDSEREGGMSDRLRQDHQLHAVRALQDAAAEDERAGPDAAFEAAARDRQPGRGGGPAVARAIDGLHASAGNRAVAWLFGRRGSHRRTGPESVAAGRAFVVDRPDVQRAPGDDKPEAQTADTDSGQTDNTGDTSGQGGQGGQQQGSGTTTPGGSWTRIGPPTNGNYTVSGSLRTVADAIALRTEAGSVTTTPTSDTDTYTPPDGSTEKVTAARVTVAQKMELPDWPDKSKATTNQQAEWNRFFAAITTHENGHVAQDKTSFAGAHSKMIGLSQVDADKALDTVTAQATTDNETYDTGNDHGKKQGTGINPNIDEVTKVP